LRKRVSTTAIVGKAPDVTTVRLPAKPSSAAVARQRIAADLVEQDVAAPIVDDVVLVVTELVSNAIRHAEPLPDGQVTVSWQVDGRGVKVRVSDGGGGGEPRLRHATPRDTSGRGLALVEAIATRWGVEDSPAHTTVWAELDS
jgi:anti-sigma regulatory factor (Ser/Thr protein kinase)